MRRPKVPVDRVEECCFLDMQESGLIEHLRDDVESSQSDALLEMDGFCSRMGSL